MEYGWWCSLHFQMSAGLQLERHSAGGRAVLLIQLCDCRGMSPVCRNCIHGAVTVRGKGGEETQERPSFCARLVHPKTHYCHAWRLAAPSCAGQVPEPLLDTCRGGQAEACGAQPPQLCDAVNGQEPFRINTGGLAPLGRRPWHLFRHRALSAQLHRLQLTECYRNSVQQAGMVHER